MAEFGGRCCQCHNQLRQSLEECTVSVVTSYGSLEEVPSVSEPVMEPIVAEFGGMYCQCHNQLWQNLEEGTVSVITSYGRAWRKVPSVS